MDKALWNEGYRQGQDYRLVQDEDLRRIIDAAPSAKTALDIGCGTGDLARKLAAHKLEVTAIDLSNVAIEQARTLGGGVKYQVLDAEASDFTALGSFDLITCKLVIAFMQDRPKFINNV